MIMMVREQELIDKGREEGREEGRENERLDTIHRLIQNLHYTPQQAMSFLGISLSEQPKYLEKLNAGL